MIICKGYLKVRDDTLDWCKLWYGNRHSGIIIKYGDKYLLRVNDMLVVLY